MLLGLFFFFSLSFNVIRSVHSGTNFRLYFARLCYLDSDNCTYIDSNLFALFFFFVLRSEWSLNFWLTITVLVSLDFAFVISIKVWFLCFLRETLYASSSLFTRLKLLLDSWVWHMIFCGFPWAEAVADANKAIELEPTFAKASLRKGYDIVIITLYQLSWTLWLGS